MKIAKSSCPVVHDACFTSLRLCRGCVRIDCRESGNGQMSIFQNGPGWPSFLENDVLIGEEALSAE
jgi:hypothetical protein